MTRLCSQVNADVLDASETTHSGSACVAGGSFGAMLTCDVQQLHYLYYSAELTILQTTKYYFTCSLQSFPQHFSFLFVHIKLCL